MRKVILISKVSHLTRHRHNCDSCETMLSQYNNETEHKEILSVSKHLPKSDDEWMVRALYKLVMDGWSTGQVHGQS